MHAGHVQRQPRTFLGRRCGGLPACYNAWQTRGRRTGSKGILIKVILVSPSITSSGRAISVLLGSSRSSALLLVAPYSMAEASTSSASMAMAGPNGDDVQAPRQVPVILRTLQPTLSIPEVPYLVPATWRRAQLSTLVNRLLQQDGRTTSLDSESVLAAQQGAIPFDFIIDGEILRTTLSKYLERKGLTEETTVEIEYVRSTLPPKFTAAFEHDDWISGVDASSEGLFLSSSYDGTLRVFGTSTIDKPLTTFRPPGVVASLTDVCWLRSDGSGRRRVAAAGMDGMLRVCSLPSASSATGLDDGEHSSGDGALETASLVRAFETPAPLSSVAAHPGSGDERLLTAGWDGCVAVWHTVRENEDDGETGAGRTTKRRKGAKGAAGASAAETPSLSPLSLLWHTAPAAAGLERVPGTNARVSGAVWMGGSHATEAASAGWDGSVRLWDVEEGRCTATRTSDKVILCMDTLVPNSGRQQLVATGQVDRSAALWDLRTATASNIALAFNHAHAAPVGAIRAHPTSSHLFATGSHDGAIKLWDVRSPRAALFALSRPGQSSAGGSIAKGKKILTVDWDTTGQTVVAGGEDCQLTVHRGEGIGREDISSTGVITASA